MDKHNREFAVQRKDVISLDGAVRKIKGKGAGLAFTYVRLESEVNTVHGLALQS